MADERTDTELEQRARAAFDAGDHARAATLCIEGYGQEVLGYLVTRIGTYDDAADVFSDTTDVPALACTTHDAHGWTL